MAERCLAVSLSAGIFLPVNAGGAQSRSRCRRATACSTKIGEARGIVAASHDYYCAYRKQPLSMHSHITLITSNVRMSPVTRIGGTTVSTMLGHATENRIYHVNISTGSLVLFVRHGATIRGSPSSMTDVKPRLAGQHFTFAQDDDDAVTMTPRRGRGHFRMAMPGFRWPCALD